MSRLTDISRDSRNSNAVRIYCDEQTALKRLYEYENINLTPYEIEEMRADAHSLHNENNKLKKELEVYKKAFNRFVEVIYQKELEKLTTGQSIDVLFYQFTLIKEHLLHDIRKELEDER